MDNYQAFFEYSKKVLLEKDPAKHSADMVEKLKSAIEVVNLIVGEENDGKK